MSDYGIGDAYWYEWYVGLKYVLLMLYPDSKIKHVTLQASDVDGIDDVVIQYDDNKSMCIQVKHTRVFNCLNFSDVFSGESSWIKKMASGWKTKNDKGEECIPILYTNRELSKNSSSEYISIEEFWRKIKPLIKKAKNLDDISVEKKMKNSWEKCLKEIKFLDSDIEKLYFLKRFTIVYNQSNLDEIEKELVSSINKIFGLCNESYSKELLKSLSQALSTWATTRRLQEYIDKEEVYKMLGVEIDEKKIERKILPQYPFFKSRIKLIQNISDKLSSRAYPIIFLKGEPGCGKSNIISELVNKNNSLIDMRYYAFEPISLQTKELPPDYNEKVNPKNLWRNLLDQLRLKLKGRLARFNVPIRNEFLSAEELKKHVLRLAAILSKEEKRVITIAIDGIDHAARASNNKNIEETFLNGLVHPDKVPEGVCFLIAGQMPEAYSEYPVWLREKRNDVLHIVVPKIQYNDIKQLFVKINPNFNNYQIDSAVRVIEKIADGNTLSAVFAVYEAKICNSLDNLEEILDKRKLHDGVLIYYKEIWTSAIKRIQREVKKSVPYIESKLAAYICLSRVFLNGKVLKNIYSEFSLSEVEWENILSDLQPLVIEKENGRFSIIHNDVRVFLNRESLLSADVKKITAGLIADFYLKSNDNLTAKHIELFRLLTISERRDQILDLFISEYVMEAWALRRPMDEISEQCKEAAKIAKQCGDYDKLYNFLSALKTVCKLKYSEKYADDINYFGKSEIQISTILESERRIQTSKPSKLYILEKVLYDADILIKGKELDRACMLMDRWFQGTPKEILSNDYLVTTNEEMSESIQFISFLKHWGKIISYTGINSKLISDIPDKFNVTCFKYIFYGFLNENLSEDNQHKIVRYFAKYISFLDENNIKELLVKFAKKKKWIVVGCVLKLINFNNLSVDNQIIFAFLALLNNNNKLIKKFTLPVIKYTFDKINYYNVEEEVYLYSLLCFIHGWNQCNEGEIINNSCECYFSNKYDSRPKENINKLFATCIHLGSYYSNLFYLKKHTTEKDIINIIDHIKLLYEIELPKLSHIKELREIRSILFSICCYCSKNSSQEIYNIFFDFIKRYINKNFYIHKEMEELWKIFKDNGQELLIKNLFDCWVGEKGLLWEKNMIYVWIDKDDLFSRYKINYFKVVEYFINLAYKFDLIKEAENLQVMIGWDWINRSEKEFSLNNSIIWASELLKYDCNSWCKEGWKLFEISNSITVSDDAAKKISRILSMASAKDGIKSFYTYLNTTHMLDLNAFTYGKNKFIYDGIIACLENCKITEEELLNFWCLTIGGLTWRSREDRIYIEDLKKAILKAAHRLDYKELFNKLKDMASLYFEVNQKRGRGSEHHWMYNNKQKRDCTIMYRDKKIKSYTIDELFEKFYSEFKKYCDSKYTIYYANELVKIMNEVKTKNNAYYLEKLVEYAQKQYNGLYIQITEMSNNFHHKLFSLLYDNSQEWKLIDIIFDDFESDINREKQYEILSKRLEDILFIRAKKIGKKELSKGLKSNLHMMKTWIEGNSPLERIKKIPLANLDKEVNLSWDDMCFELLLKNISCKNASQVEVALQGLWKLIELNNNWIQRIPDDFEKLSHSGKVWMMMLFEKLVITYPNYFIYIDQIVNDYFNSNKNFELKVQAWIVLFVYMKANKIKHKSYNLIPEITGVKKYLYMLLEKLNRNDNENDYIPWCYNVLTNFPIIYFKLLQMQIVLKNSLCDIQYEIGDILVENLHESNTNFGKDANMYHEGFNQYSLLMSIFYNYIKDIRCLRSFNNKIVQTVTNADDPFILLQTPTIVQDRRRWFNNIYELAYGLNKIDPKLIKKRFIKHIKNNIKKDEVVIGAQLQYFSINCNYIFTYELENYDKTANTDKNEIIYNYGVGRAYTFYDNKRYEPKLLQNKLFIITSNINQIPYSGALIIPTTKFQKLFNLKVSEMNPLIFERKGRKVLWLENYIGPINDEMDGELYRQHILQRWVCNKDFFSLLEKKINNLMFTDDLQIIKLQIDRNDLPDNILIYD